MTVMPRRSKVRWSATDTSRSSSGTIAGRYSTSVTATPRSWNADANSAPTAPAPTMTMLDGSSVMRSTSSEVMTRLPSGTIPGSDLTREPVARITSVAVRTRSPPVPGVPSAPWSATRTRPGPSRRPRPATHSTPFLPTRLLRPVHMRRTTGPCSRPRPRSRPRRRSRARRGRLPPSRILCARPADSRIALVGMQPRWRQVPPILSASTSATLRPSWAARNAAV